MNCRAALVCAGILSMATTGLAQYSTGFENPPFSSGQISGQDQWTTTPNPGTARVLTSTEIATELTNAGLTPGQTVHSGSQALVVSGPSTSNATIRVMPGLEAQPMVRLDVWTRPLMPGTTGTVVGNIFLTLEDAAGVRAAAFRYDTAFGGPTIDYGTNVPGVWQPSNVMWDGDTWYHITLDLDYTTKTYDMAVNGNLVTTSPITFYNTMSASFSQIRIFRGTNRAGMIVDDLAILAIPEPTAAAALLVGTGAFCLRRRRKH